VIRSRDNPGADDGEDLFLFLMSFFLAMTKLEDWDDVCRLR